MQWRPVTKQLKEGSYVVKTRPNHKYLKHSVRVLGYVSMHYDEKGKQVWSCKSQEVFEYLDESDEEINRWKRQIGNERKPGSTYIP